MDENEKDLTDRVTQTWAVTTEPTPKWPCIETDTVTPGTQEYQPGIKVWDTPYSMNQKEQRIENM